MVCTASYSSSGEVDGRFEDRPEHADCGAKPEIGAIEKHRIASKGSTAAARFDRLGAGSRNSSARTGSNPRAQVAKYLQESVTTFMDAFRLTTSPERERGVFVTPRSPLRAGLTTLYLCYAACLAKWMARGKKGTRRSLENRRRRRHSAKRPEAFFPNRRYTSCGRQSPESGYFVQIA